MWCHYNDSMWVHLFTFLWYFLGSMTSNYFYIQGSLFLVDDFFQANMIIFEPFRSVVLTLLLCTRGIILSILISLPWHDDKYHKVRTCLIRTLTIPNLCIICTNIGSKNVPKKYLKQNKHLNLHNKQLNLHKKQLNLHNKQLNLHNKDVNIP